jgi:hypothetical protein
VVSQLEPPPSVPNLNAGELEELLSQLREHLPPNLSGRVESLLRVLLWVLRVLAAKGTSLTRLRDVLFRPRNEKSSHLFQRPAKNPKPPGSRKKGHGRKKASAYTGAKRVPVCHETLQPGQICSKCGQGKLYLLKEGAHWLYIQARPIFDATLYELEQLRCALCGALFTAQAPAAAAAKYDPSVGLMLSLLRYGAGLPMYRIAKWQACFGVPLPASTQWELIAQAAAVPELIYHALIIQGAQASLVHNDDTSMRVQSLRRQIAEEEQAEEGERTGIFTTSLLCQVGEHQISLFFTGRDHAGENLDQLLQHRAAELSQPLQMCDALARNLPKKSQTQECYCLAHARRNFVEQLGNFPLESQKALELIGVAYERDAEIKAKALDQDQRLTVHQARSGPAFEELRLWMQGDLDQNKVEPNSGLGKAFNYMLRRWSELTRFLRISGAPLDNTACERALKTAIMHRKNSLSYKTERGAKVGDIFMSLIHTCQLNKINPFDYLLALQKNAAQVRANPSLWLPWNYQQALRPSDTG